jgi:hypothetical protein
MLRIEIPRVTRQVPGLGETLFRALGGNAEIRLARHYVAAEPDHREFVNEVVAAAIGSPTVDPTRGLAQPAF